MDNYLGNTVSKYRRDLGMSIKELALKSNISSSMLSQIESGTANPSLNSLRALANALNIPVFCLFAGENTDDTMVVRKENRIKIIHNSSDKNEINYDLLTPDLKGTIEFCELNLAPSSKSLEERMSHAGEEVAICSKGQIMLHLESKSILLNEGDSVRIPPNVLHRWENPGKEDSTIIFAISPPSF